MTTNSSTATLPHSDLMASLEIIEIKPGLKFSKAVLRNILPDVETALFFGKVYDLDLHQLSLVLSQILNSNLVFELTNGAHSTELQSYLIDLASYVPNVQPGDIEVSPNVPHGEILPAMWEMLEVEVASSIKQVAAKLASVVDKLPGKQGQMVFKSMMTMNTKRPTVGTYAAAIHRAPRRKNLLILDVSGSMTAGTISAIVNDTVALGYKADADLAIVSNTCFHWEAGAYSVDSVLRHAEYGGTFYEELAPLLDRDWGTVITVADYDSSPAAKELIAARCTGSIEQVLDISLVNRPTFLAQCVGQLAKEVRPLLVAAPQYSRPICA